MSDGSSFGLTADQSLRAVLGDRDSVPEKGMTASEMAAYLEACPDDPNTYENVSRWIGKHVMHFLVDHPEHFKTGDADDLFDAVFPHTTDSYSATYPQLEGVTGFMVGWGCNAGRYAHGRNELPNPAIITLDIPE
jgi:hypothetical protein